jgi:hypothetical protein
MDEIKNIPLSASRIKTLQTCSWLYYFNYILKLPDKTNHGSLRGSCVHNIFECLGNPRHKKHYNKIIKKQDSFASAVVERYVRKFAKKHKIDDFENIDSINYMILSGLNYDFFSTKHGKPTESISEKDFDISVTDDSKNYRILGFIDKLFLFKKKSVALIRDFKSSKSVFTGDEVTDNIQHLMYCLAVKHLYPEYTKRDMEFLFLKFDPENGGLLQMEDVEEDELEGFEFFLNEIQKIINKFDEKIATSSMAYDKGYPSKNEGFCGRAVCGRAEFAGQLKKDGTPMWHCKAKFAQEFWVLKNEKGETVKSAFLDDKKSLKEIMDKYPNSKIEKFIYNGCPKFQKKSIDKYDSFL